MNRIGKPLPQLSELLTTGLLFGGLLSIILPAGMVRVGLQDLAGATAVAGLLMLLTWIGLQWQHHRQTARSGSRMLLARDSAGSDPGGRATLTEQARPVQAPRAPGTLSELRIFRKPPRPQSLDRELLRVIEWRRFQAMVELLFQQAGYVCRTTPEHAVRVSQIRLHPQEPAGEPMALVCCRHAPDGVVDRQAVSELDHELIATGVPQGQLVTSGTLTPEAQAYAEAHGIVVIDGAQLLAEAGRRSSEQQQALLAIALQGDFWRPSCTQCGNKLWPRVPAAPQPAYWTCSGSGFCRVSMPLHPAGTVA